MVDEFQLTKTVFPNANFVIDRFHIVKHLNQAFQDLHVKTIKFLQKKVSKGRTEN